MRVASWNAKGLFACRASSRRKKASILWELAKNTHVIAVQEAHGNVGDAEVYLHQHIGYRKFFSPCEIRGAGGILFVIDSSRFSPVATFAFKVVVPGRIARLEVRSLASTHIFWNIHNFGVTERCVKQVKKEIQADKRMCVVDPASVAVFVMGDWNFLAQGERRKRLDRPELHA